MQTVRSAPVPPTLVVQCDQVGQGHTPLLLGSDGFELHGGLFGEVLEPPLEVVPVLRPQAGEIRLPRVA